MLFLSKGHSNLLLLADMLSMFVLVKRWTIGEKTKSSSSAQAHGIEENQQMQMIEVLLAMIEFVVKVDACVC